MFYFGRRKTVKKTVKRPARSLLKMCRKYKIKCTRKVGRRRVYKSTTVLKRQLRKKMKSKTKKTKKSSKRRGRKGVRKTRRRVHRFRFGDSATHASVFTQPKDFGYNEQVQKVQGVLPQSSQVVTPENNINRPPGFVQDQDNLKIEGLYRPFFTEKVPTMVGPNSIGFMRQPDGSLYAVAGSLSKFTFGKRRRRRY